MFRQEPEGKFILQASFIRFLVYIDLINKKKIDLLYENNSMI